MATTQLAVVSDRSTLTTLNNTVLNMTSVSEWSESWTLPTGFGDCMLYALAVNILSIQTIVAAGSMRGPAVVVFTNSTRDVVPMPPWVRSSSTSLFSAAQMVRPVLWRGEETLVVQSFSEDAGAGNTSDMSIFPVVLRLRNIGPS